MLRSIGKQSGESVESVLKKKRSLRLEGFAEREGLKPGMKVLSRASDGTKWDLGEYSGDSTDEVEVTDAILVKRMV